MATIVKDDIQKLDAVGEETPGEDFQKLIKEHVENCVDDNMKTANFQKYSAEIRKIISAMFFKSSSSKDNITKALKAYREEASFYNPYDYNDWIKEIKSRLFEKEMLDMWQDVIVNNQLGLLWARDCDFFEDVDDKEPIEFYKTKSANDVNNKRLKLSDEQKPETSEKSEEKEKEEKVTSVDHYVLLVKEKVEEIDPDDEDKKLEIFDELSDQVRDILMESILKATNLEYTKLSKNIKIYRDKACFFNPYDYNDWIKEVKFRTKQKDLNEFWENVIVKNELGLLSSIDCDFFDDMDDDDLEDFYKINSVPKTDNENLKVVGTDNPAHDYKKLVEREVEELDPQREEERMDIFDDLSKQIQIIIKSLLFDKEKQELEKAALALKAYREEACFYNPYDYNEWIKEIKIQIIENKMENFWENVVVKQKLGLLWARDCDFFDDIEDKEPENFYKIQK